MNLMNNNSKNFIELNEIYYFKQLINDITRDTTQSSSIIDLIFINNQNKIGNSGVIKLDMSDHYITFIILQKRESWRSKSISLLTIEIGRNVII